MVTFIGRRHRRKRAHTLTNRHDQKKTGQTSPIWPVFLESLSKQLFQLSLAQHIPGNPFFPPPLILRDVISFVCAGGIMMISRSLDRMVQSIYRDGLFCIRIPSDSFISPSKRNKIVLFFGRLCIMMLASVVRI